MFRQIIVLVYCFCGFFVWVIYQRQAKVTPIPKGPPSSSVSNYRPSSITSVLSKVFERLVSVCLVRFMERSGVLPTTKFAFRKGQGTCEALLCVSHTLQNELENLPDAMIIIIINWSPLCKGGTE